MSTKGDKDLLEQLFKLTTHENKSIVRETFLCIGSVANHGDEQVIEFLTSCLKFGGSEQMIYANVLSSLRRVAYRTDNETILKYFLQQSYLTSDEERAMVMIAKPGNFKVMQKCSIEHVHEVLDDKSRKQYVQQALQNEKPYVAARCCRGENECVALFFDYLQRDSNTNTYMFYRNTTESRAFYSGLVLASDPYSEPVVNKLLEIIETTQVDKTREMAINALSKIVTRVTNKPRSLHFATNGFEDLSIIVAHGPAQEKSLYQGLSAMICYGKANLREKCISVLKKHPNVEATVYAQLLMVDRDDAQYLTVLCDTLQQVSKSNNLWYHTLYALPSQLQYIGEICSRGSRKDLIDLFCKLCNYRALTYANRALCLQVVRDIVSFNDETVLKPFLNTFRSNKDVKLLYTISVLTSGQKPKYVEFAVEAAELVEQGGNLNELISVVRKHGDLERMIKGCFSQSLTEQILMMNTIVSIIRSNKIENSEWKLPIAARQKLEQRGSYLTKFILLCDDATTLN
jgi:hypothetical protein